MLGRQSVLSCALVALPVACSAGSDAAVESSAASANNSSGMPSGADTASSSSTSTGGLPQAGVSSATGAKASPATSTQTNTATTAAGSGGTAATTATTTLGQTTGGAAGASSDDSPFVPEDLTITKVAGAGEGLHLVTLTFLEGPNVAELYAAVTNQGETSACDAAITIEFFDRADQSVAAWVGGLYTERLYQRSDAPETILGCLDPGDTALLGSKELPQDIAVDEVGSVAYRFSYFDAEILPFDLIAIDAVTVAQLEVVNSSSTSAYQGILENGLDLVLSNPGVTIFPMNQAGRPLGMATAAAMLDIQPGGSWAFETNTVDHPGVSQSVYLHFGS